MGSLANPGLILEDWVASTLRGSESEPSSLGVFQPSHSRGQVVRKDAAEGLRAGGCLVTPGNGNHRFNFAYEPKSTEQIIKIKMFH